MSGAGLVLATSSLDQSIVVHAAPRETSRSQETHCGTAKLMSVFHPITFDQALVDRKGDHLLLILIHRCHSQFPTFSAIAERLKDGFSISECRAEDSIQVDRLF